MRKVFPMCRADIIFCRLVCLCLWYHSRALESSRGAPFRAGALASSSTRTYFMCCDGKVMPGGSHVKSFNNTNLITFLKTDSHQKYLKLLLFLENNQLCPLDVSITHFRCVSSLCVSVTCFSHSALALPLRPFCLHFSLSPFCWCPPHRSPFHLLTLVPSSTSCLNCVINVL